jgi:methionyl aminopeptidase
MILIKSAAEIAEMRKACRLTAQCMDIVAALVRPGVTTAELDRAADVFIRDNGGIPTFKGYNGYPANICTSVNEEVVHGIPGSRVLREGDIVGVDLGATLAGFTGDMTRSFAVGDISSEAARLIDVTRDCFFQALEACKPGARIGDVGWAVQKYAESKGFSVVRDMCGHGVGRSLHEEPEVPNFGRAGRGMRLEAGMTLAIEPMINQGHWQVEFDRGNGWTVRTADRKLSAHYEETVLITADGALIMTAL